ncbi:MAG: ribosome-associated translation inhibitor RaiA [Candidatus Eisenbacteria bacterium]
MRIEITARELELTDSMREHIEERLTKLRKYFEGVLECHVYAHLERFIYKFEIKLHGTGFDLFAEAHAEDLHAAFEKAAERMERQVKKQKDKIKDRRGKKPGIPIAITDEFDEVEDVAEEYEGT